MSFVQIIEHATDQPDAVAALGERMRQEMDAAGEQPRFTRIMRLADRDRPGTYFTIIEFPSHEAARENNDDPRTQAFAAEMMQLSNGEPKFYNLDLIESYPA
jgi:hypothetical protein